MRGLLHAAGVFVGVFAAIPILLFLVFGLPIYFSNSDINTDWMTSWIDTTDPDVGPGKKYETMFEKRNAFRKRPERIGPNATYWNDYNIPPEKMR